MSVYWEIHLAQRAILKEIISSILLKKIYTDLETTGAGAGVGVVTSSCTILGLLEMEMVMKLHANKMNNFLYAQDSCKAAC